MTRTALVTDISPSATVRIEPLGYTVETLQGEPLMRAARRSGLRWPTICNGVALCGTCHCRVVAHSEPITAPTAKEAAGLALVPPHLQGPETRLACQFVPSGDVTVERVGVQLAVPNLSKGSAND
jgi:2Fe-2S ferredoxin